MHILFDIGKTKTRIARYDGADMFSEQVVFDTPGSFEDFIYLFEQHAKKIANEDSIESAIGGIGAPLNKEKTETISVRWAGEPIKKRLEEAVGVPVYLENDSAMVGLGEAVYGAGVGDEIVAYITVSTGVGGARIVNGGIDEASIGFEPGHQIVDADKSLCLDCAGNTLEDYISGTAIENRFNKKPYEIEDEHLWREELPKFLAYGLNNIVVNWSPDSIVLGGSMIVGDPAISVPQTANHLREILKVFPKIPIIKMAKLDDVGGLYGAMAYLKQMEQKN